MTAIELQGISKHYGDVQVVCPTSLKVEPGELVTLLGPSGSGKSTILSMIAGLVTPTDGRILIGDKDVTNVPPAQRNLGMVFQSYALFPNMTVHENVRFPLSIRKLSKQEMDKRVRRALEMVRLDGLGDRKPHQLSGGQQQRVALARALVFEPAILLLDEPLGALDKKLREEVQIELRQLQRELGVTTILVTHDQEEALTLSTRLVVLDAGKIQQVDTPRQAYRQPANRFVAEFIGTANLWPGEAQSTGEGCIIRLADGQTASCQAREPLQGAAYMMLRPEDLEIRPAADGAGMDGTVTDMVYLGQNTRLHIELDSGLTAVAVMSGVRNFTNGQAVRVTWRPEHAWLLPAASG